MKYMRLAYQSAMVLGRTVGQFGFVDGSRLSVTGLAFKAVPSWRSKLTSVKLRGLTHPIFFRPGTSDWKVLTSVFVAHEYVCPSEAHDEAINDVYLDMLSRGKKPIIVDCGANIGMASIWYALLFPEAVIIAIEPEPENFRILSMNARYYPMIQPVLGGILDRESHATLSNAGGGPWAWETAESDTGEVITYTIPGLIEQVPDGQLLVVKIDIEGSETGLFRSNLDWAAETPLIVFEPHDWLFNWRGTFHAIMSVLVRQPRDYLQNGENTFSIFARNTSAIGWW